MSETMYYAWAIGMYTGEQAKSVIAHGFPQYLILDQAGKGAAIRVKAAFRKPLDGPWPSHLLKATTYQAEEYEKRIKRT